MSARQSISGVVEASTSKLEVSVGLQNKVKCSNTGESRYRAVLAVSWAQISKFFTFFTVIRKARKACESHTVWLFNIASIEIALLLLLDQICLAKSRHKVASMRSTEERASPGPLVCLHLIFSHAVFGLLVLRAQLPGSKQMRT